jgi:hypothetical protein
MPEFTFLQSAPIWLICVMLFLLIILFNYFGHAIRRQILARRPDHSKVELTTVNGILLGLLGLLLAFTFGMANNRYDRRRELIIEEANDIGTAVLRADLYPDSTRQLLRKNFQYYLESRIAYYEKGTDFKAVLRSLQEADSLSKLIWRIASEDARANDVMVRTSQMIPALNAMIDITTTRWSASESTIPDSIMLFLFMLAIGSAFLVGYDNKGAMDWIMNIGFALILSFTVFTILDLDRSRKGFIKMDLPAQKIVDLRGLF